MKKLFTFICATILMMYSLHLNAQPVNDWTWAYPKPAGITFQWCKMFDANTMYAAGYYGGFIKTTNGGTTWTYTAANLDTNTGAYIYAYGGYFLNMNTGFLCGSSGSITKTTDAGVTWNQVGPGPTSTNYDMYFINNNTGFTCGSTTLDISKTTDGGDTWTDISGNIAGSTKYCVYAWDADNVVVGTTSGDTYRTTNGGTNWTMYDIGYSATIRKIIFMDANTGFCSGSSGTVRLSTNGGVNWTSVNPGPTGYFYDIDYVSTSLPPSTKLSENFEATTWPPTGWTNTGTTTIWGRSTAASGYGTGLASARAYFYGVSSGTGILTTVAFSPTTAGDTLQFDHAYATYISENDQLQIYYSTNSGSTWTSLILLNGGVSGPLVTAPPTTGNFVPTAAQWATKKYALPGGTNMLRFNGITAYGNNLYVDNIKVTAPGSMGYTVYVTGDPYTIFKTTDMGTTWDSVSFLSNTQPLTSTYYSTSLSTTGDTLFTVGPYGFMNKGVNSPANNVCYRQDWTFWNSTGNAIDVVGNTVIVPSSYSAVLKSTNLGATWDTSKVNYSYSGTLYGGDMYDANNWMVGGTGGRAYGTTDAGTSWTEFTTGTTSSIYKVEMVNANVAWLGTSSGQMIMTTNGGANWDIQTTGVTSSINASCFLDANTGWFGEVGDVGYTTNGGANWTLQDPQTTTTIRGIDFINANTGWLAGYTGTVRKTTNGGANWDTVNVPYTQSLYHLDFVDEWNGMVVGFGGITYRTRDGGTTWIFENTGSYTHYGVKMITTDSGFVASSNGYVFKYVETLTGHNTYTHEVPKTYVLSQNYPNPFNPTTTIKFALPKAGRVSLKIYDISGRLIRTLVNNEGLNEGTFNYIFNGSDIASGVYFYSLIVNDDLVGTKKMVLVK